MHIRAATAADHETLKRTIREARINPLGLDWRRFLVMEDDGQVVGMGQIKPHGDGSCELASIAVVPERRGQGIATQIIETLLARERSAIYLTCRAPLETFYTRFGFRRIARDEMPPYFRRLALFMHIGGGIVMKRAAVDS